MQIDCPGSVNFLHSDCADSWTLQALSSQVLFLQSHINLLTVSNLNQILEISLVLLQDLNTYIINLKAPSLSKRPPQIFLPLCPPKNIIWAKELTFRSTKYRICTHNFSANEEISFLQDGENGSFTSWRTLQFTFAFKEVVTDYKYWWTNCERWINLISLNSLKISSQLFVAAGDIFKSWIKTITRFFHRFK